MNVCVCIKFHKASAFTCLDGDDAITVLFASSNDTLYVPTPLSVNMLAVTDVITKLLVAVNTGYVIGNWKTKLLVLYVYEAEG